MTTEQIQRLVKRFDDMLNKPDINISDEIFAPHFIAHLPLAPTLYEFDLSLAD